MHVVRAKKMLFTALFLPLLLYRIPNLLRWLMGASPSRPTYFLLDLGILGIRHLGQMRNCYEQLVGRRDPWLESLHNELPLSFDIGTLSDQDPQPFRMNVQEGPHNLLCKVSSGV
jgi:hypothetical protein